MAESTSPPRTPSRSSARVHGMRDPALTGKAPASCSSRRFRGQQGHARPLADGFARRACRRGPDLFWRQQPGVQSPPDARRMQQAFGSSGPSDFALGFRGLVLTARRPAQAFRPAAARSAMRLLPGRPNCPYQWRASPRPTARSATTASASRTASTRPGHQEAADAAHRGEGPVLPFRRAQAKIPGRAAGKPL